MKKLFLLTAVLFMSACSLQRSPVMNTTDVSNVDFSAIDELKTGEDCSYYLLGLIGPFGNQELVEAVEDAEISTVKLVDSTVSYRGFYSTQCVKVYGE